MGERALRKAEDRKEGRPTREARRAQRKRMSGWGRHTRCKKANNGQPIGMIHYKNIHVYMHTHMCISCARIICIRIVVLREAIVQEQREYRLVEEGAEERILPIIRRLVEEGSGDDGEESEGDVVDRDDLMRGEIRFECDAAGRDPFAVPTAAKVR